MENVINCSLPFKFKQIPTFWGKRVESNHESNNTFNVTYLFPFNILTGRTRKKTCEFSDEVFLILLTTKNISGFSLVFIEFYCGAVGTVFTLLGFTREFEFGIDFYPHGVVCNVSYHIIPDDM